MNAHVDCSAQSRTGITFALCLLVATYAVARILQVFPGRVPMLVVVELHVVPPCLFALLHAARRYGLRGAIAFFAICLLVGGTVENFGVLTGFPFGHYYFTELMGPKILSAPVLLGLAYIGLGYVSWTLGALILGEAPVRGLAGFRTLTVPLIASFIMVAWDLAMDPVWSTVLRAWVWVGGGHYFGVPISNFLGWYLTVYLLFQLFALYLRGYGTTINPLPRSYWNLTLLFYAVSAAGNLLLLLPHRGPEVVFDSTGAEWQVASITAATALVSIFVMGAFTLLAWAQLSGRKTNRAN